MGACKDCPYKKCIGPINCNESVRGEIVEEYSLPSGTHVVVMDGAYRGKTSEELAAVKRDAETIALGIAYRAVLARFAME
jgi:hypothetical protein